MNAPQLVRNRCRIPRKRLVMGKERKANALDNTYMPHIVGVLDLRSQLT